MAQNDDHPDQKIRHGRRYWQEMAPYLSNMPCDQNVGKIPAVKHSDTHPFSPWSTWLSAETLDMLCTDDDHRRHCCRLLK